MKATDKIRALADDPVLPFHELQKKRVFEVLDEIDASGQGPLNNLEDCLKTCHALRSSAENAKENLHQTEYLLELAEEQRDEARQLVRDLVEGNSNQQGVRELIKTWADEIKPEVVDNLERDPRR